jgi:chemotaxis protein methyltransferase CheR
MTPSIFDGLRQIAHDHAGIAVAAGKEALVTARLAKRIRALGLRDERDYLDHLRKTPGTEITPFFDALATNVTSFFREADHFTTMAEHVATRVDSGAGRIRVWSAACSTGEEPLSMALVLEDLLAGTRVDWRVLGTDLSTSAITAARRSRYCAEDIARIPQELRTRSMQRVGDEWEPTAELAGHMIVDRLNLARTPYPLAGPFDVIFCRNAMIYFSAATKQRLVREVERLLRPGGLFIVGHAESLQGVETSLRAIRPSVYEA